MGKVILSALLVCALCAVSAQAEQRGMSRSKLSNLGLASMQSASDELGSQVRGLGSMFVSGARISVAGPSSSSYAYGANARGSSLVGIGFAQTFAEYTVVSPNFIRTTNATAFGRSLAWVP